MSLKTLHDLCQIYIPKRMCPERIHSLCAPATPPVRSLVPKHTVPLGPCCSLPHLLPHHYPPAVLFSKEAAQLPCAPSNVPQHVQMNNSYLWMSVEENANLEHKSGQKLIHQFIYKHLLSCSCTPSPQDFARTATLRDWIRYSWISGLLTV